MAIIAELQSVTQQHFMPVVTNQIYATSPILFRIFRTSIEGQFGLASPSFDGRQIVEPLEYAKVASGGTEHGAYNTATTWVYGTTEVVGSAAYDWKMYFSSLKIHNRYLAENQGKARLFDLAAIKLKSAAKVLREDLITDFYLATADGSDNMIGIRGITAQNLVIGGIDQTTTAWWRGYKDTAAARDLTWLLLNKAFYNTKKYGDGDRATIIVASEGVMQKYEDNLTKVTTTGGGALASLPLVQLQSQTQQGGRTIDGGFEAMYFKRIPMVADPYCTASIAYMLNEKYLHWRVLKNFEATGWQQQRINGKDWVQNTIFGYGALTSSANRKQGWLDALNEA